MCPFCERVARGETIETNDLAVVLSDAFPVSPGHALVVPRRHEPDFFALTTDEIAAIWRLVATTRTALSRETVAPHAYNIGVNAGVAAGQTVDHAHLHVIPRYAGDVTDPRGGVRWVLPARAAYWRA